MPKLLAILNSKLIIGILSLLVGMATTLYVQYYYVNTDIKVCPNKMTFDEKENTLDILVSLINTGNRQVLITDLKPFIIIRHKEENLPPITIANSNSPNSYGYLCDSANELPVVLTAGEIRVVKYSFSFNPSLYIKQGLMKQKDGKDIAILKLGLESTCMDSSGKERYYNTYPVARFYLIKDTKEPIALIFFPIIANVSAGSTDAPLNATITYFGNYTALKSFFSEPI